MCTAVGLFSNCYYTRENLENDIVGLGRLVAVFSLGAVVLVMLEHCGWDSLLGSRVEGNRG